MTSRILSAKRGRELAAATLGVAVAVAVAGGIGALVHGGSLSTPWLAATVGSSAVLVFTLPASPLAQPWPVVGGNGLSALAGVAVGHVLGHGTIACGLAAGSALGLMSAARCLHPPGAGAALVGVSASWLFPLAPIGLNMIALIAVGLAFHRLTRKSYPHRALPLPDHEQGSGTFSDEDLDAVMAGLGETFDINRDDLRVLLERLQARQTRARASV